MKTTGRASAPTRSTSSPPVSRDAMATAIAQRDAVAGRATAKPLLVYFSSISGNTARFVEKLGARAVRIPLHSTDPALVVDEPYVLITPTYGGGQGRGHEKGAVPKQV